MSSIRIFCATHIPIKSFQAPFVEIIQVGAAQSSSFLDSSLKDNTDDNISAKNDRYNELTALYWAWKNDKSDYVGLFHYRRHLNLNPDFKSQKHDSSEHVFAYIHQDYLSQAGFKNKERLKDFIEQYDLILPTPYDSQHAGIRNNLAYFRQSAYHKEEFFHSILEKIRSQTPALSPFIKAHLQDHKAYYCQLFIMKRELLEEYCQWLFSLLADLENTIDYTLLSISETRALGFIAERLFDIYVRYWKASHPNLRWCERPKMFIQYPQGEETLKPAFSENSLTIISSTDQNYLPYASVWLESLLNQTKPSLNYDIILMHDGILSESMSLLLNQVKKKENVSLRFWEISHLFWQKNIPQKDHISASTCYRLKIPQCFKDHSYVIYLDIDMIVLEDPSQLIPQPSSGEPHPSWLIKAPLDINVQSLLKKKAKVVFPFFQGTLKEYLQNYLQLSQPFSYFQASCLVFNMRELAKTTIDQKIEQEISQVKSFQWMDQDILNKVFSPYPQETLPLRWNIIPDIDSNFRETLPSHIYQEYQKALNKAAIIHYAGPIKPWQKPESPLALLWWQIAQKTPFFALLLSQVHSPTTQHKKSTLFSAIQKRFPSETKLGFFLRQVRNFFRRLKP